MSSLKYQKFQNLNKSYANKSVFLQRYQTNHQKQQKGGKSSINKNNSFRSRNSFSNKLQESPCKIGIDNNKAVNSEALELQDKQYLSTMRIRGQQHKPNVEQNQQSTPNQPQYQRTRQTHRRFNQYKKAKVEQHECCLLSVTEYKRMKRQAQNKQQQQQQQKLQKSKPFSSRSNTHDHIYSQRSINQKVKKRHSLQKLLNEKSQSKQIFKKTNKKHAQSFSIKSSQKEQTRYGQLKGSRGATFTVFRNQKKQMMGQRKTRHLTKTQPQAVNSVKGSKSQRKGIPYKSAKTYGVRFVNKRQEFGLDDFIRDCPAFNAIMQKKEIKQKIFQTPWRKTKFLFQ